MTVNGNDLSMMRGDSDSLIVSCCEGDSVRPFAPGDVVTFAVRYGVDVCPVVIRKEVRDFTDGGRAVFLFEPEDTASLKPMDYIYDVQLLTADGWTVTIIPSQPSDTEAFKPAHFTLRGDVTP